VLLAALYVIPKPINRGLALPAAFWKLVYALACVLMTVNLFDALRLLRGADLATSFWLPFKGLRLSGNPTGAPVSAHVRVASLIGRWGAGFGPCQSSEKYLHCVHLSRV
jgi:hypothetical protein